MINISYSIIPICLTTTQSWASLYWRWCEVVHIYWSMNDILTVISIKVIVSLSNIRSKYTWTPDCSVSIFTVMTNSLTSDWSVCHYDVINVLSIPVYESHHIHTGPGSDITHSLTHWQSGALSLVKIPPDTVLWLVEPYYADTKVKAIKMPLTVSLFLPHKRELV